MISLKRNEFFAGKHYEIVKTKIQYRAEKIIKNGITLNKKKIRANASLVAFLKLLNDDTELKRIILAKPEDFIGMIASLKRAYPDFFIPNTDSNKILFNLFLTSCYEDLKVFDKHTFIKSIALDTCCYCNRNYIYYIAEKKSIKPEIDHFYPKDKYPLFGISFYNLIPSCKTCNGFGAKEQKDPIRYQIIHPYLIDDDDFHFNYEIKTGKVVNSLADKESIELKMIKHIPGNVEVFKLKDLYDQHKDHVVELIMKSKVRYAESYREYLKKYDLPASAYLDRDLDRMIVGNFVNRGEAHKRPLGKLYQDIAGQLGLIDSL